MIKRIVFSTVGLGLLGMFFFGRSAASYVSTSWARLTDSVEQSVPVEFQIDRARKMVKDLVPDIQRNMHVIAKEEVEVDQLEQQIADVGAAAGQGSGRIDAAQGRCLQRARPFHLRRPDLHARPGENRSGESLRAVQDFRGDAH